MTSKELVLRTLEFRNTEERAPRQLWTLPWATEHYSETMKQLEQEFIWDFDGPQVQYQAVHRAILMLWVSTRTGGAVCLQIFMAA